MVAVIQVFKFCECDNDVLVYYAGCQSFYGKNNIRIKTAVKPGRKEKDFDITYN